MEMQWYNWIGFLMLFLALLLNELFLGINAWYELNLGAVIFGVIYLLAGATLSLWPGPRHQST